MNTRSDAGKARKVYDPEVRAAAMAALLAGQGVNDVARAYRLPPSTVSRWKRNARAEAGRTEEVGDLLLIYLKENLTTLQRQSVFFRDREWLLSQCASDAAVLHGVLADKTIRLLEAMEIPSDG